MPRPVNKTARLAVKALRSVNPTMRAEDIAESLQISLATTHNIINELGLPHLPTGGASPKYPRVAYQIGETAEKVIELRKSSPCAKLQDIADKVGVTRERVRQILKRDNLPTRHYVQRQLYECLNCGAVTRYKKYCSPKCSYEYTHPLVECDNCHKLFRCPNLRIVRKTPNKLSKFEHLFCSKQCQGAYSGTHYGFRQHPENTGSKNLKYDYELIRSQALELHNQGLAGKDIASKLNLSFGTFQYLMHKTQTRLGVRYKYNHELIKEQTTILRSQGLSYSQIAKQLHISYSSIYKIAGSDHTCGRQPHDETTRLFPVQHIRVNWLKHLNFTDKEIKRITGCSSSTLYRAMSKRQKRVTA